MGKYINANEIVSPFKNGYPNKDWWLGFSYRHKLSLKKPQVVECSRKKACNPFTIYGYFELLRKTMDELNIMDKPDRIWNLDETSFCLDPSKTKIVGAIGTPATRTTHGSGRDNTSVLMACSAIGQKAPPLIIFKGKNIWDKWVPDQSDFPGTTYAATTNGWMERYVLLNYFEKSFLITAQPTPDNPVLLIYDGHSSHVDLKLIEIAINNNVTILLLPPHSSHLIQPMNLAVFKSVKTTWDQRLCTWNRHHYIQMLPKQELSRIICNIWATLDKQIIKNGFKKAGIYPYNYNAIDPAQFDPLSLSRWNLRNTVENNNQIDINQPSTSKESANNTPEQSTNNTTAQFIDINTFEEMLLNSMKQIPIENTKRRQVSSGASVITYEEAITILREKDLENNKPKNNKRKKQADEVPVNETRTADINTEYMIEQNLDSFDEELDLNFSLDSDDNDLLNELLREEENLADERYLFRTTNNIGDWILVKYDVKEKSSNEKHYVGIIKEINDNMLKVRFVKLKSEDKNSTTFVYPIADDIDDVSDSNVVCCLPQPTVGRRSQLIFGITFSQYNLKK